MTRNNAFFLFACIMFGLSLSAQSQDLGDYTKQEIKDLSQKAEDQVRFLEYFFNTLGSRETPARDKDVIIRESYLKIFRDGKVQVEDDLLLDRKVITNKDITSYLKDIEFFFRDANFQLKIREVKPFMRDNDELSFLVSMDRTITAVGLNNEKISNTRPRFVEVNVDKKTNELKIASMYTTKLSRDEELKEWWASLSYTWESYFREKFGHAEGDSLSIEQLYKISQIDSINLSGNEYVVDLEAIEALRDLKYIDISNTRITELNPISNVTFLTHLNIANTPTKDIQFIKYSDRLTHLDISGTEIRDLRELGNLKQLSSLKAVKTPIMSFGILNSFESLRQLDLRESGLNNLENITQLTELTKLDVSHNYLMNFELLTELENLEELILQETNIIDLSPLSELKKLRLVNINQTEVSDLSPLNGLPALQRVYADRTGISELNADVFTRRNRRVLLIHHVENLQTWYEALPEAWKEVLSQRNPKLNRNTPAIEDLSATVGMDTLDLSGSAVNSLGPILKFKKINYFKFDDTDVQDLSPLTDIQTLTFISGQNSKVNSVQPIRNLANLKHIDLRNTEVESILELDKLKELEYLNVDNTPLDRGELPEFLAQNPKVNVIYRSQELENWWDMIDDTWKEIISSQHGGNIEPSNEELHKYAATSELSITRKSISNLVYLAPFNNLRKLEIHDVPLTDISALENLKLLEELRIAEAPILDLGAISKLSNLKSLDVSNTGISDLRGLSPLLNLEVLNVSGTNIRVLRGLEPLNNLRELDIANTNVRTLKPIIRSASLEKLICFNTRLNKRAVDIFRKQNPETDVRYY